MFSILWKTTLTFWMTFWIWASLKFCHLINLDKAKILSVWKSFKSVPHSRFWVLLELSLNNMFNFTSIEKQVFTTYTNHSRFCFPGTTPVLAPKCVGQWKSQSRDRSRDSNKGPHDCKANALPHDHGHHIVRIEALTDIWTLSQTSSGFYFSAVQVFRKHCGR